MDNLIIATDTTEQVSPLSSIIDAIVEQRHNLGISQRELAERCSLPHSSVARIEAGRTVPNLNTLIKLCSSLELSLSVSTNQNQTEKEA